MIYTLDRTELLPIPIEEAWLFFSDPCNLSKITPPQLCLRITSGEQSRIYTGMILTYKVSLAPFLKSDWVTEITHLSAPEYFVDEQRFGPYRFWHHKHFFTEKEGSTEARDLVHYRIPLGPLGRAANALFIRRQLDFIFDYRSSKLRELFGIRN